MKMGDGHYKDFLSCNAVDGTIREPFQEMTSAQVEEYAKLASDAGSEFLYSLNRERSRYNVQLSSVSELVRRYYDVREVELLDTAEDRRTAAYLDRGRGAIQYGARYGMLDLHVEAAAGLRSGRWGGRELEPYPQHNPE